MVSDWVVIALKQEVKRAWEEGWMDASKALLDRWYERDMEEWKWSNSSSKMWIDWYDTREELRKVISKAYREGWDDCADLYECCYEPTTRKEYWKKSSARKTSLSKRY